MTDPIQIPHDLRRRRRPAGRPATIDAGAGGSTRIHVRLSWGQLDLVGELAAHWDCTRAEAVRLAVELTAEAEGVPADDPPQ